jgi:hypothetical protein
VRLALSAAFVSAVADRLGWWGPPGTPGVVWGNFEAFLDFTQLLNPFVPAAYVAALGWAVTGAEVLLGVMLLLPFGRPWVATLSGVLISTFGVAMALTLGIKAALDYSVFSAAGAAFLLALTESRTARRRT